MLDDALLAVQAYYVWYELEFVTPVIGPASVLAALSDALDGTSRASTVLDYTMQLCVDATCLLFAEFVSRQIVSLQGNYN